jgi:hypothetical protein
MVDPASETTPIIERGTTYDIIIVVSPSLSPFHRALKILLSQNSLTTKQTTKEQPNIATTNKLFNRNKMSFLRQTISKLLLPNLERDVSKSVSTELSKAYGLTDCFASSSSVYAYLPQSASRGGPYSTTQPKQQSNTNFIKVDYSYRRPSPGLFQ